MSLDELRRRRAELQSIDDAVSYVRRVAHGRADLARDAITRSSDDRDPTPVYARRDLHGELRDVLADRLLGDERSAAASGGGLQRAIRCPSSSTRSARPTGSAGSTA